MFWKKFMYIAIIYYASLFYNKNLISVKRSNVGWLRFLGEIRESLIINVIYIYIYLFALEYIYIYIYIHSAIYKQEQEKAEPDIK